MNIIVRYVRFFCCLTCVLGISYCVHTTLRQEYHKRCNSNMFLVIMFKDSTMCKTLHLVIGLIEKMYYETALAIFE